MVSHIVSKCSKRTCEPLEHLWPTRCWNPDGENGCEEARQEPIQAICRCRRYLVQVAKEFKAPTAVPKSIKWYTRNWNCTHVVQRNTMHSMWQTVHRIISLVQYGWDKGEITIKDSSDYPATAVINVVPQLDRVVLEEMEGKIINFTISKKKLDNFYKMYIFHGQNVKCQQCQY